MADEPAKVGRPSAFTPEVAETICAELAKGRSLRSICEPDEMPAEGTVRGWALEDRGGFFTQYTRARDLGLDSMADEVIDIADKAEDATKGRLRFDARRWYLSKLAPKRYGEKVELAHSGEVKVTRIELVGPPPE